MHHRIKASLNLDIDIRDITQLKGLAESFLRIHVVIEQGITGVLEVLDCEMICTAHLLLDEGTAHDVSDL